MSICSLVNGDGPLLCGKSSRPAPSPTADPTQRRGQALDFKPMKVALYPI
jgi:hypothetical protein